MEVSRSFVLLHLSLSRLVVSDLPRRMPTWAPIEFYAAIEAMDSVESCMDFIAERDMVLTGWRIFSSCCRHSSGRLVQMITGFEPLLITGEAIAYARPAAAETFVRAAELENLSKAQQVPQELIDLLEGRK